MVNHNQLHQKIESLKYEQAKLPKFIGWQSTQNIEANLISLINALSILRQSSTIVCTGTLISSDGKCVKFRATPEGLSNDANLIDSFPPGTSVQIHGKLTRTNGEVWYLVTLTKATAICDKNEPSKYTNIAGLEGWVFSGLISLDNLECEVEEIDSRTLDQAPIVDDTGQYYSTLVGLRGIRAYTSQDPNGWWGADGLDNWELAAWSLYSEADANLVSNLWNEENLSSLNNLFKSLFARFLSALLQGQGLVGSYDPFAQFFSGLPPRDWDTVEVPLDFNPLDPSSVESFASSLSDAQERSFLSLIMSGDPDTGAGMDRVVIPKGNGKILAGIGTKISELQNLADDYNNVIENMKTGQPLTEDDINLISTALASSVGVYTWWSYSEIACSQRALSGYKSQIPDTSLYIMRFPHAIDSYFYIGTPEQMGKAGIIDGSRKSIKNCSSETPTPPPG